MNRILVYGLSQNIRGGIETFLLNMNAFMSSETIFDYVIEGTYTIHQEAIDNKGGKCFYISKKKSVLANIVGWKRILKNEKSRYQIVYFNLYSLAWIVPIFIALKNGYTVIVHAHNNMLHNCGLIQKFLHRVNRLLQRRLNIFRFANSELSAEFFFGANKAEIIYNAIDINRFIFNESKRNLVRLSLGIKNEEHLYGFSGRLVYQKNPLFLIDIFHEISKIDSKARFIICGDGLLSDKVKIKSNKNNLNIIFTGNVANLEDYYCAMDYYILPSRFEGLGIVLIEAQCSGLPCVASSRVIPQSACATDLLHFLSLSNKAKDWAHYVVNSLHSDCRIKYGSLLSQTRFNIKAESKHLENRLICLGESHRL